ncbi:ORF6N domain-containing protein [candidate division TA06 bacterium]|nr:ORF6N domain-containing protein [candidate division TA06 bacterium]
MKSGVDLVPVDFIEQAIHAIRGHKIILDHDLANLYGVPVKVLNQAVKRNIVRFPEDFMFQLTVEEQIVLRSQIVTLKPGRGGHRKYRPYAFTEQGVAMLSGVLNSDRAIAVNIEIMRTFVKMRRMLTSHDKLAQKVAQMEKHYDGNFKAIFAAIKQLIEPDAPKRRPIGFKRDAV